MRASYEDWESITTRMCHAFFMLLQRILLGIVQLFYLLDLF